jgi:hypothetical protein
MRAFASGISWARTLVQRKHAKKQSRMVGLFI